MDWPTITAAAMLLALGVYAILGGADFGGGVWDFFAFGPRKQKQRALIADAIGPVWEANHVWLIVVVVLMFSGFPRAFSAMMTALHVPLTLMLIGIVLRGCAFTFRSYDSPGRTSRAWSVIFSTSSVITPLLLGACLGAAGSGRLRWNDEGVYESGYFAPWAGSPFCWSVGAFALSIFAFLAATYLCIEARGDREVQEDFRRRAIVSGVMVGAFALLTWLLGLPGSGDSISHRMAAAPWAWPLQIATALFAIGALAALWRRRYRLARFAAAGQVLLITLGFGLAMRPNLIIPGFTIENSAAPAITHKLLLGSLGAGAVVLIPSLLYLFRVFKGGNTPSAQ